MAKINIKYMSDSALEYCKANIALVTDKLAENPSNAEWLRECIPGELFVAKKYEIDPFVLEVPESDKDRDTICRDAILLYEKLSHLPGYVLSDERFWLWLHFEVAYEAVLKMMPVKSGKSVFKDHWLFTQGQRRGQCFGVLSRLYHCVALTVDEGLEDRYELTRFALSNFSRYREYTWRTFSSNKTIIRGALKAEKAIVDSCDFEEDNDVYVELAKAISRAGSVRILDCMTEEEVQALVTREYLKFIEDKSAQSAA